MCFPPANPVKLNAFDWYFERSENSCIPFHSPPTARHPDEGGTLYFHRASRNNSVCP